MKEKTKIFPFLLIGKIVIKMENPIVIPDFLTTDSLNPPQFFQFGYTPRVISQ